MITFKEYLIREHTEGTSTKGIEEMFANLDYWFDLDVADHIKTLEQQVVFAGGVAKFVTKYRHHKAIKHFLKKHIEELEGDLLKAAQLMRNK